ncbi:hypothetical protein V8E53_010028 [Lactarius tabidus]
MAHSCNPYEDVANSLMRPKQHLTGLRSDSSLQYEMEKAHRDGKVAIRRAPSYGKTLANVLKAKVVAGKATPRTRLTILSV